MRINPVATLRCWAVYVDLGEHTLRIPPLPASDWLVAVVVRGWAGVVPGLAEVPGAVADLIADGSITERACDQAGREALAAAAGCPWWTAQRLAHACAGSAIGAELTLRGVDPTALPLGAYLAAGWHAASRGSDPSKLMTLEAQFSDPPADMDPDDWWDDGEAAANFMAAASGRRR